MLCAGMRKWTFFDPIDRKAVIAGCPHVKHGNDYFGQ